MKNIVFCGYNVFPIGFAQMQRLMLIAKGLSEQDVNVLIMCRYGTYNKKSTNIAAEGVFENIPYIYCSGESFRRVGFLSRNVKKLKGLVMEFIYLLKKRITGKLDYIFVSTNSFENAIYYSLLARLLFTKSLIDNTEYWSAVKRHKFGFGEKIYDFLTPILYHKVICISDFLYEHTLKFKKQKHILKIPAIVDFSKFNNKTSNKAINDYVLFCGSAVYFEVVNFIISSYEVIEDDIIKLILVCSNGRNSDFEKLNDRIASSSKKNLIILKRDISYKELVSLYQNSLALLIPLRPTIEDRARFPHKLGEYTASKSLIITTNLGEIPNYFRDLENALISKNYSIDEFGTKIDYAIKEKIIIKEIKQKSFETGLLHFDYKINGKKIYNFLYENQKI